MPEFGKFIKFCLPQDPAEWRDSVVIAGCHTQPTLIHSHCAELSQLEQPAANSHPLLTKQNRARRIDAYRNRCCSHYRRGKNEAHEGCRCLQWTRQTGADGLCLVVTFARYMHARIIPEPTLRT